GREADAKQRSTQRPGSRRITPGASASKLTDVPMDGRTDMDMLHGFTLILEGLDDLTPEVTDRLFEAGCDDPTPWHRDRVVAIDFDRAAPTLRDAISSAIQQVENAGIGARIVRIEDVTSGMADEAVSREVGSLNSVLHATAVINMDPTLRPFLLQRLGA